MNDARSRIAALLFVLCCAACTSCGRHAEPTDLPIAETHDARQGGAAGATGSDSGVAQPMRITNDDRALAPGQYSLLIETETSDMQGAYDNDTTMVLGMREVGGRLVVFVNDSPMRLHSQGSGIFAIYDMLQPGTNTVRIFGRHRSRMFIKVLTTDPTRFKETFPTVKADRVLAKTWLDPAKESITLAFEMAVPKGPDWEELPEWPKDEERLRREVGDLVHKWVACCNARDLDGLFRSWMPDLRNPLPYLTTRDAAMQAFRAGNDPVTDTNYRLTTDASEVNAIFGKRTVILYTGFNDADFPYLFRFSSDRDTCSMGAITLGRLEGHWVVQHMMR